LKNEKQMTMKKMIVTLAIVMSTFGAFAGEEVTPKVLNAFKTEFSDASHVKWLSGENYYKASFMHNSRYFFAYYNAIGELLALKRFISPLDLPLSLQKDLKENYKSYWVSDLMEVAKDNSTTYYITLENANAKLVLKTEDTHGWSFYKRVKKD